MYGSGQLFYCLQKIHKIRGRFSDFEGRIEVRVEKGNESSLRQFNTVLPAAAALWRAAESFDDQRGAQFHSYAISVIHNHLLDYCRRIQSRSVPLVSLEDWDAKASRESAAAWDGDSSLYVEQVLEYGKRTYSGVAKLGVEALELKIAGYSGTDIAELYGVKPNHVGAWITRAAQKLKKDIFSVENSAANS